MLRRAQADRIELMRLVAEQRADLAELRADIAKMASQNGPWASLAIAATSLSARSRARNTIGHGQSKDR
jgi:hypothetical protein